MTKDESLLERTIDIINKHGYILLKRKDGWYLSCWTNIAGGIDCAKWSKRQSALEISHLKWAFALAKLYDCKVVSYYPERSKKKKKNV